MADTATANVPTKKPRSRRRALKEKNHPSGSEANILAGKVSDATPSPVQTLSASFPEKENHKSLSQPKKSKAAASKKHSKKTEPSPPFEKELHEMQEKLWALGLEKKKTKELLKEKDAILKLKEKEQDKLQMELKELQKMQMEKPTTKTKEQKKNKEKGKTVDPNISCLFSKEARKTLLEERPGTNNSTITDLISVKWKELSEEERKVWNDKEADVMEAHKKKMKKHNKSAAATLSV